MKNKILKKIILVAVSITVLVSVLVIPSFAYSVSEPSTDNPGFGVSPESIVTPYVFMNVELYANGSKKTSAHFPLFTNSNVNVDNRIFLQIPDSNDYGQLSGYSDTVSTDIYETGDDNLFLLRQSQYSYIVPNYNTSGVDFDYAITDLYNYSIYYNSLTPWGMNYSTFIYLDDTYNVGDSISYTYFYDYLDENGVYQGSFVRQRVSSVTTDEEGYKGIYIYYYESVFIDSDWLVFGTHISFDTPIIIDDYSYGNESGFIRTTSRHLCSETYGSYLHDYLANKDIDTYNLGFSAGRETGYTEGFARGESTGFTTGYNSGYSEGESVGRETGYTEGFARGESTGYTTGYNSGYSEGESVGYNTGYDTGYTEGYNVGFEQGGSGVSTTTPFQFILSAVSSFLSWEFIPGVSFSLIASVFVGAILMIILLKKLAGG